MPYKLVTIFSFVFWVIVPSYAASPGQPNSVLAEPNTRISKPFGLNDEVVSPNSVPIKSQSLMPPPSEGFTEEVTTKKGNTEKQFLKSIIESELPSLVIDKPNIDSIKRMAKQGDANNQYDLGNIYSHGSWLPQSDNQATYWWLKSSKQGYVQALKMLYGHVYSKLHDIQSQLAVDSEFPKTKAEKLHNTLQMLATYNEKAFIPKHQNIIYRPDDKIDRLNWNLVKLNLDSFNIASSNEVAVNKDSNSVSSLDSIFWDKAKKGDIDALYDLGSNGFLGTYRESPERFKFLIKAAELGHIQAQYELGYAHWQCVTEWQLEPEIQFYIKFFPREVSYEQHLSEAIKWSEKAANSGHIEAQLQTAEAYLKSNDSLNALKWYTKALESGQKEGIKGIASLMHKDESIKATCLESLSAVIEKRKDFDDDTLAHIAFTLAYKTNNAKYCKQAVELYEMIAERGDSITKELLGSIYSQKKGCLCEGAFEKNIEKAIYWYKKGDSKEELASLYFESKEYREAFDIFKNLAEQEREECTRHTYWALGHCYYEGLGTAKNYYQAYKWFLVYKYYASEYNIDFVEEKLSPTMINKAQQEAGELVKVIKAETQKFIDEEKKRSAEREADTSRFFRLTYTEWRKEIETISQLLNDVMPKENLPAVYGWIDEEKSESDNNAKEDTTKPTQGDKVVASGTGFFITSDGFIITAYHVVKDAAKVKLVTNQGIKTAVVEKFDSTNDIAILKAENAQYISLPIKLSMGVKLGADVFTVGFPNVQLQGFEPKYTKGNISSLSGIQDDPRHFQISTPVQPGNSGGPLIDSTGNVIGIVVAKMGDVEALEATGSIPQNVNYAIKSSFALALLETVPDASQNLKPLLQKERNSADVVDEAQKAVVLILCY